MLACFIDARRRCARPVGRCVVVRRTGARRGDRHLAEARGEPAIGAQTARFEERTGRANLEWTPLDDHLLCLSYSKVYKGGGFNPPTIAGTSGVAATYAPDLVNAIEFGSKNEFAGGRLVVNAAAFHYDYKDYQIAKAVGVTVANENVDATIDGFDLEIVWHALDRLRLSGSLGLLDTVIDSGRSIDLPNRTQRDPSLTYVYLNEPRIFGAGVTVAL